MPQVMMSSPHTPTKVVLLKMLRKHTYRPQATVRNCLYLPFVLFLTGPSKEPAMKVISKAAVIVEKYRQRAIYSYTNKEVEHEEGSRIVSDLRRSCYFLIVYRWPRGMLV